MTKLIALDIDGTLINSKLEITPRTKKAVIRAMEEGHKVVIASGRDPMGVEQYARELDFDKYGGLLSNFNGGRITNYKTGEIIADHPLDLDLTREILDFARDLDIGFLVYKDSKFYTNSPDTYMLKESASKSHMEVVVDEKLIDTIDFQTNKILFSQVPERIEEPSRALYDRFHEVATCVKSTPFYYEIMPKGIDKGKSLLEIADHYKISQEDIIAFGDENNDLTMIEKAGVGVAMANSSKDILEIADYVTLSNDEDGIAYYLENFLFDK